MLRPSTRPQTESKPLKSQMQDPSPSEAKPKEPVHDVLVEDTTPKEKRQSTDLEVKECLVPELKDHRRIEVYRLGLRDFEDLQEVRTELISDDRGLEKYFS